LQFKIPILREEGERERERVSLLSRYDKTWEEQTMQEKMSRRFPSRPFLVKLNKS
jgi:hypothetical protein